MVYMDIDWQDLVEKEWWEESLLLYMGLINIDRKKTSNDIVKTILTGKLEIAENGMPPTSRWWESVGMKPPLMPVG